MITYCKTNITEIPNDGSTIWDYIYPFNEFDTNNIDDILSSFDELTSDINGAVYNCFFSFTAPAVAAGYTTSLSVKLVSWNLLFNLGFMYTDIYSLYTEFTDGDFGY